MTTNCPADPDLQKDPAVTAYTVPDYITVGARVALLSRFGGHLNYGTVERINKASVTVDGQRYVFPGAPGYGGFDGRGNTVPVHTRRSAFDSTYTLVLPVDDPEVVKRAAVNRAVNRAATLLRAAEALRPFPQDPDLIAAAQATAAALTPGAVEAAQRVAAYLAARAPQAEQMGDVIHGAGSRASDHEVVDLHASDLQALLAALGRGA